MWRDGGRAFSCQIAVSAISICMIPSREMGFAMTIMAAATSNHTPFLFTAVVPPPSPFFLCAKKTWAGTRRCPIILLPAIGRG